jgi:hypothetical protein
MNMVFFEIARDLDRGIERDVMTVLAGHQGKARRVSRSALVEKIGRLPEYRGKNLVRVDRQVRLAIVKLQEQGYPILSDSGKGGYWLAGTPEEVEATCAELLSRCEKLQDKVRNLRKARRLVWGEPEERNQIGLWDEGSV